MFVLKIENTSAFYRIFSINRTDNIPKRLQVFKNGAWHDESTVEEPYEPGCAPQKVAIDTTICHCTDSLCNSANKETISYHTDAMAVIFVFNAMKYLRSVD